MTSTTFAQAVGTPLQAAPSFEPRAASEQESRSHVARSSSQAAGFLRATENGLRTGIGQFRHEPRRKRSNLRKDHLEVLASDA